MKPEPLNGKTFTTLKIKSLKPGSLADHHRLLSEKWVRVSDLKSACEFYLKYKNNPIGLWNEYPQYRCKRLDYIVDALHKNFEAPMSFKSRYFEEYNAWLFKLAFKDIFEVDKK